MLEEGFEGKDSVYSAEGIFNVGGSGGFNGIWLTGGLTDQYAGDGGWKL